MVAAQPERRQTLALVGRGLDDHLLRHPGHSGMGATIGGSVVLAYLLPDDIDIIVLGRRATSALLRQSQRCVWQLVIGLESPAFRIGPPTTKWLLPEDVCVRRRPLVSFG